MSTFCFALVYVKLNGSSNWIVFAWVDELDRC